MQCVRQFHYTTVAPVRKRDRGGIYGVLYHEIVVGARPSSATFFVYDWIACSFDGTESQRVIAPRMEACSVRTSRSQVSLGAS